MKIKLAIVLLLCTACTVIPSCKTVSEKTAADSGTLFLINTVTPHEARSTVIPITESQASDADSIAVILTAPYINRYTLDGSLDFDAFVEYLSEYYTELYGDQLVICVTDMIDYGDSTDGRGVVTVLAEYHSYVSLESGRNADTLRGGCNFFFSYDVSSGADFSPRPFVEDTYLHSIKEAIGNDFSEYTAMLIPADMFSLSKRDIR